MKTRIKYLQFGFQTILLLVTALASPVFSHAQSEVDDFQMIAKWSPGDTFVFKITDLVEKWDGNELAQNDTSHYYADLTILEKNQNGFRLRWEYSNYLGSYGIPESQWEKYNAFRYQEVICLTDSNGVFQSIENLEELRNETLSVLQASLDLSLEAKEITKEHHQKTLAGIKELYTGESGDKLLVDDFIIMIHSYFGRSYPSQQQVHAKEWRSNPFGGNPIAAESISFLEKPNRHTKQIRLVTKSILNEKGMDDLMRDMLKKIGVDDAKLNKTLDQTEIKLNEKVIYDFNYELTIASKITSTSESIIKVLDQNLETYETTQIELTQYIPAEVN